MAGKLNVGARHAGLQRPAPAGLYTTDRTLRRSRSARPVAPPSRGAARLHFCSPEGRIQRNRPACAIVNETPGGVHGEVELGAEEALLLAIERRASAGLFQRAAREGTTAFRLLHGPTEGAPGVSVDLYGTRVLVQSWREPLGVDACDALGEACRCAMRPFVEGPLEVEFHLRGRAARQAGRPLHQPVKRGDDAAEQETFSELGLSYHWQALRAGGDPSLFLDFRPVRRLLAAEAAGKDVLNLFSYTCGAGVAALAGGAASVVNVDHSAAYLAAGKRNTALNAAAWEGRTPTVENIAQDFYTAARQMAGIGIKGRASRGRRNASFPKLPRRDFDLVVLDPPTLTKSAFGAVDIVNDYASLAKPALLCTRPGGGTLVATNHAPHANAEEWLEAVVRCGKKCGRPVAEARLLEIEQDDDDFPPSLEKPRLLKVGIFTTA
eukprot:jgi/Tetstr1/439094/TSEL_002961.t1